MPSDIDVQTHAGLAAAFDYLQSPIDEEVVRKQIAIQQQVLTVIKRYKHSAQDVLIDQGASQPEQPAAPDKPAGKRRERGPSADVLETCRIAMKYWLEDSETLAKAAQLAGVDKATVQKWMPNVLAMIEPDVRARWITRITALDKRKWLGK